MCDSYNDLKAEWSKLGAQVGELMIKADEAYWSMAYNYDAPNQKEKLADIETIQGYLENFSRYF